jgi:hypothetical protein
MLRLGLRLTLHSGREAFVRLLVTAAAVAIGVAIMLAVLADFHAFKVTNDRPYWEGTQPITATHHSNANVELWNYSDEVFRGQTIERVDVAALGPDAPVLPGVSRLPGAGQYYASPALARLIRSTPRDELGARFPGTLAGTIGQQALTGPDELVVFAGYSPGKLASLPTTVRVDKINTAEGKQVWSPFFRDAFIVGALAFLFPILILIGTATKLASARREERYASLRLVGATARDINVIASVESVVGALLGALVGIGIFELIQPPLARSAVTSAVYFRNEVTPTLWGYLGVLVAVPAAAAIASLIALRRVRITPLGVSRRVTPPPPRTWRIVPLLAGIALFVAGILLTTPQSIGAPALPGLLVIMIGLVIGGPWLTAQAARLLPKLGGGAAPIFAARRLADNPKAAFRSVSGLVLAVFLGTAVAALLPAINATTATTSARALSNVMPDQFISSPVCGNDVNCTGGPALVQPDLNSQSKLTALQKEELLGLPPAQGDKLVSQLRSFRGVTTVPIYSTPQDLNTNGPAGPNNADAVVPCAGMKVIGALGECAPGDTYAQASTWNLYGDNPTYTTQPIISASSSRASGVGGLYLQAVLVKVHSAAALEVVRTFLITHTMGTVSGSAARTFGEAVQARLGVATIVQRLVDIAVGLTLLVAGCSLAVAVGGGLVERKRPFTMLRLSGTSTATLNRVVLLEAVLPLAAATVVAGVTAYLISLLTVQKMGPAGTPIPALGHVYFETMGAGLILSLLIIAMTLPLLRRITGTENVRFELEPHVVVLHRQVVDPDRRRHHPARELSRLVVRHHERGEQRPVIGRRQPPRRLPVPLRAVDDLARRADAAPRERPDLPVEPHMRQHQPLVEAGLLQVAVPLAQPAFAVGHVLVPQVQVQRRERGHCPRPDRPVLEHRHLGRRRGQNVVVVPPRLHPPALEPSGEIRGGIRRRLRAEQVEGQRVVLVQVPLDHRQRDRAVLPKVVGAVPRHQLRGLLHDPLHAGGTDEHVVRFFAQHELGGPRQRVEAGLLQRAELVFAVPVGEVGEHEERQPVSGLLVERTQDPRTVRMAGMPPEQLLRLFPAVPSEVGVQQVDHGPQVPALLDVDLEQVAQVVQARRGGAEVPLLLDRGGLGVALHYDQPPELTAVLAGDLRPGRLALVLAERDLALLVAALGQEDAPAVLLHRNPRPARPAVSADRHGGAQVHVPGRQ